MTVHSESTPVSPDLSARGGVPSVVLPFHCGDNYLRRRLPSGPQARRREGRVTALMIQGAGSNVGKSLLVAGLCRAAARGAG